MKLNGGNSQKDRITLSTADKMATAIREKNGLITIKRKSVNINDLKDGIILFVIFVMLSLIKAYIILPLIENEKIETIWYLVPSSVSLLLAIYGIIDLRIKGGQELLRNHGAEHKVIAAYKKLNRIPTVEEANKFSRISKSCGVTLYASFITVQLIGYIVYINSGYVISELLLFLINVFFQTVFPFNFIGKLAQFLTTSNPKEENVELAIAALCALEEMEEESNIENLIIS